eukprot:SAG31_NODE_7152_length_1773_cov_1.124851_2_plen_138_part_00
MLALDLVVSDVNKKLLLASDKGFIQYLVDGLLLQADHPRAQLQSKKKAWLQQMHCQCLAQLALWPAGTDALMRDPAVLPALEAIAESGMLKDARAAARQALLAFQMARDQSAHDPGGAPTSSTSTRHGALRIIIFLL